MSKPLESVTAFARFSLSEGDLRVAEAALANVTNWQMWLNQVELHGLSGLANKHITEQGLVVPADIKLSLKALMVRHKSAANARYKTLQQIDSVLAEQGVPYLALKGAALMPYLYGEDHLRPMRDMDLLVPEAKIYAAADCLRGIGFDLPEEQDTKYQRDMHQLPNATKIVDGFTSSVELHRDAFGRELKGHLHYPVWQSEVQAIQWRELKVNAFEDLKMIHQVSKHLEGLHSGALLKLINVVDVVGLAMHIDKAGKWQRLEARYPHVINTLRCLHLLTPLPASLQQRVAPLPTKVPNGVGQIMGSMRTNWRMGATLKEKLKPTLLPSDWWLHLYYNVNPDQSLRWVKLVTHPLRVTNWLSRRLYSRLRGG